MLSCLAQVVQCLSMLVVFYLGDVVLLGRGQGNMCRAAERPQTRSYLDLLIYS